MKAFLEGSKEGARAGMRREGRTGKAGGMGEREGREEGRHGYPVPLPDHTADRRPARVLRGTFSHTEVEV